MGSIGSLSRCVPSIEVTNTQPKISPDISQCHHAIPGKLKSEKEMQKFHTDDTPLANVLGCAPWEICFNQSKALPYPVWVVIHHHCRISGLVSQTSFHEETS